MKTQAALSVLLGAASLAQAAPIFERRADGLEARAFKLPFKPVNRTPVHPNNNAPHATQGQGGHQGAHQGGHQGGKKKPSMLGRVGKGGLSAAGSVAGSVAPTMLMGGVMSQQAQGEPAPPQDQQQPQARAIRMPSKPIDRLPVGPNTMHAAQGGHGPGPAAQNGRKKGGVMGRIGKGGVRAAGNMAPTLLMGGLMSQQAAPEQPPQEAAAPPTARSLLFEKDDSHLLSARSLTFDSDDDDLLSARSFDSYSADSDPLSSRSIGSFFGGDDDQFLSARAAELDYEGLLLGRDDFYSQGFAEDRMVARDPQRGGRGGGRGGGGRGGPHGGGRRGGRGGMGRMMRGGGGGRGRGGRMGGPPGGRGGGHGRMGGGRMGGFPGGPPGGMSVPSPADASAAAPAGGDDGSAATQ